MGERLYLLVAAIAVDAFFGDPERLWKRVGHPIAWIGSLIGWLDRRFNRDADPAADRRRNGILAMAFLIALTASIGVLLSWLFARIPYGWIGTILIASVFLAGRSLIDHVVAVRRAFPDLNDARVAVGRIVGRDPASLDESGVCRAAIETTAESFSDGVVAPAFWFVVFGLPGLLAYKAINTADSMIGHLSPRHAAFGWAAARLDDIANWPAARISGVLIALAAPLAGGRIREAFSVMRSDARHHRSPNAGWPEAAMAGALRLALMGPRRYAGEWIADPFLNPAGRLEAKPRDIGRALRLLVGAGIGLILAADLLALVVSTVAWWL